MAVEPTFEHEQGFWSHGFRFVAGVDEVGRGAMAGPLVAAAVILPPNLETGDAVNLKMIRQIRDSKTLTRAAREGLIPYLETISVCIGVGAVEADELDEIGVNAANRIAMERAIQCLTTDVDALLLDAMTVDLAPPQVGLIDGDARCLSIAAASVVAKVTRDRVMVAAAERDTRFGFEIHKGYCTQAHLAALNEHGPGPIHRRCYAPVIEALARFER